MALGESKGIAKAREIYNDRSKRAKELKAEGKKIIGYLCIYPVIEMVTAAGMVPYRLFGDIGEPRTKVEACLPTVVCPYLRSTLDIGLKGRYDFLDGVVMAHACEVAEKLSHIWKIYLDPKFSFFIDTPHTTHKAAVEHMGELLSDFKKSLEKFTGLEITKEALTNAIEEHNEQRRLIRDLYELRKSNPPLISGSEIIKVIMAVMSIPAQEGNDLVTEVIGEVKSRDKRPEDRPKRLLIWGSIIDDDSLYRLIEEIGADVVMDDTCVGSRAYFSDVELTSDPIEGLARHYLLDLKCPRTFFETDLGETKKDYMADLKNRFEYIKDYAKDWGVDGIILHSLRYCDIHSYEVPGLRDYFELVGIPNIYIEPDYTEAALAPLRTRIEAFLETLD